MTHLTIVALAISAYYGGLGWFLGGDIGLGLGCLVAAAAFGIVAPILSIPTHGRERTRGFVVPRPAAARTRAYRHRGAGGRGGSSDGRIGQGVTVANNR